MITGIIDGMVMQRNALDFAEIIILSDEKIEKTEYYDGKEFFSITFEKISEGEYKLQGIPVGGPYTVFVNGRKFRNIYVGDVWILAGQSNMQGVGRLRPCDLDFTPDNTVRAFYMDGRWRSAKHPLHNAWIENGVIHSEKISDTLPEDKYQGVGLGLSFAKQMKEKTGVPQGLICTAYGGSPLLMWSPSQKETFGQNSLYQKMYNRVCMNGKRVAGMLWFQGCADAFECGSEKFEERTVEFFESARKDFGFFPIIQFQIGRVVHPELEGLTENWMKIREIQRNLHKKVKCLYTVSSINKTLDDLIHLSADSSDELGNQAAEIMQEICGKEIFMQEISSIELSEDKKSRMAKVTVTFSNVVGGLKADGRPCGFTVSSEAYTLQNDLVFDVKLEENRAVIYLWCSKSEAEEKYLCYGFGLNPYCNITDSKNRAILCFGPIKLGS